MSRWLMVGSALAAMGLAAGGLAWARSSQPLATGERPDAWTRQFIQQEMDRQKSGTVLMYGEGESGPLSPKVP